jgi:hypothetical protein
MNLKARVKRLEGLHHPHTDGRMTIDVLDRVVNGTISEEEFARWMPFWEKILADRENDAKGKTPCVYSNA